MTGPGPASFAGRRSSAHPAPRAPGSRPYPQFGADADARDIALEATRALVHVHDGHQVVEVLRTVVHDLGGIVVPARFEPPDALPLDLGLGLGDPLLVVVDPMSPAALRLGEVLPRLLDDAWEVLRRLQTGATAPVGGTRAPAEETGRRYLDLLARADGPGAKDLVRREVRSGVAPGALVSQVLAPAQREVGERWYRGEWSVADEHAATAVTDAAVALLPTAHTGPHVVIAAPQGEWHTLPGRLAAVAAGAVRTTVLGPGLPAEHLYRYLDAVRPELLALSCTLGTNLIAAHDAVRAAHDAGVPVVAGGRAFGTDGHRAAALGADAWSADPGELPQLAGSVLLRDDDVVLPPEALLADAVATEVLLLALERHAAASPWLRTMSARQRDGSLDDLRWIARHAAAALACDDPRLLDELLAWLDVLLRSRGVPAHVLPDGACYLADALQAETPTVARLVADAAAALR